MAEIAGLILAGFPLLISAMEHYGKTAEVLNDWWKYKKQYTKMKRLLERQHLIFRQNLEKLLGPIVEDDDHLKELLENAGSPRWKEPGLQRQLEENRLPNSYGVYMETMEDFQDVMQKLRKKLKPDAKPSSFASESTPSPQRLSALSWNAIKFGFGGETRQNLLTQLENYNGALDTLLKNSEDITTSRDIRKLRAKAKNLQGLRRYASNLFYLLTKLWCDSCKGLYNVNLLLRHHINIAKEKEFRVSFMFISLEKPSCPSARISMWREMAFKVLPEGEVPHTNTTQLRHSNCDSKKSALIDRKLSPRRFSLINPKERSASPISALTPPPTPPALRVVNWEGRGSPSWPPKSQDMIEITNFCTDLTQGSSSRQRISFIKCDEPECHYSINFHILQQEIPETISLETLLNENTLNRQGRYYLALILASSHLQLHSSPWLNMQWGTRDIIFLTESKFDQPYITRLLPSIPPLGPGGIDNGLFSLGVVLLELCFGIPLNKYRSRVGLPPSTDDYVTALHWCNESVEGEAGPEYAGAVSWCLRKNLNPKWKEELFGKVVEPLKCCYEHLSGSVLD